MNLHGSPMDSFDTVPVWPTVQLDTLPTDLHPLSSHDMDDLKS
jgi:hypothetical protein